MGMRMAEEMGMRSGDRGGGGHNYSDNHNRIQAQFTAVVLPRPPPSITGWMKIACIEFPEGSFLMDPPALLPCIVSKVEKARTKMLCFFGRVAKKVRDSFPLILMAEWDLHLHNNKDGLCSSSAAVEKPNLESHDTNALEAVRESYVKACKLMDKEINMQNNFDCYCSGTTAVTVVKQGQHLVIGNVGDSRAVLCTRDHDDSLVPVQLTTDFKPSLPREAERIKLSKGRVFGLPNEPEVARVWLPNIDSPGLAMSRAFGDFCLKDFGLISLPDVSYHHISDKDEFVVLATDGIWDVLSNREVLGIVGSVPRSCAARIVVDSAVHAWRTKFPAAKIDDCSVVCLFFDSDSDQGKSPSSAEDMMMMMDEQSEVGTVLSATNTIVGPMQPLRSRTNTTSK
ncbi:hypothetical protein AHAS_Ahas09G0281800 [Arachis hypogaea]